MLYFVCQLEDSEIGRMLWERGIISVQNLISELSDFDWSKFTTKTTIKIKLKLSENISKKDQTETNKLLREIAKYLESKGYHVVSGDDGIREERFYLFLMINAGEHEALIDALKKFDGQ